MANESTNRLMLEACETGDIDALQKLLHSGASPDGGFTERGEPTPLLVALYHKQLKAAKLLIQAGANVHYSGVDELAADCESFELIRLLTKQGVKFSNDASTRILRWAQPMIQKALQSGMWENPSDRKIVENLTCTSGNLPLLQQFVSENASLEKLFLKALEAACEYRHVDVIKWLLEAHSFGVGELYQAIQTALRNEYNEIAILLLPSYKKLNPNANQLKNLLLESCVSIDNFNIVKTLVQDGVDMNCIGSQNENFSPLMLACLQGHIPLVKFLLDSGADVNLTNPKGITALMYACHHEDTMEIVNMLLQAGADVNHVGEGNYQDCFSPLMLACVTDNLNLAQTLLQAGADVNLPSKTGKTALMCACENGRLSIVKLLLDAGANINASDNNGNTALMYGCEEANLPLVQLLVASGADIKQKNRVGKTAFMKVQGKDWPDIEALLNPSSR